jgi:hypothetical protein
MQLLKLWDAADNEILVDLDRATTPLPYKKLNRLIEFLIDFALFLVTGRKVIS